MSRKSTRPGWKKWFARKRESHHTPYVSLPQPSEPLRTEVWVQNGRNKAHAVSVYVHNLMSIRPGMPIMGVMQPFGLCPSARKVEWVGKNIYGGSPELQDRCSHCSALPAQGRKL